MKRRRVLGVIVAIAGLTGSIAVAAALSYRVRWTRPPTLTVISAPGDPRIPLVLEAVDHWNQLLTDIGTSFRFGEVSTVTGSVPEADLLALGPTWRPKLPESLQAYPGDVLVVLSEARFISLTAPRGQRVIVAIKGQDDPRMTPNILRNVIAHELGHAIGLDHNADPTLLMCGRPAPCRPDIYRSDVSRFLPISDDEKAHLRRLYPDDWGEH